MAGIGRQFPSLREKAKGFSPEALIRIPIEGKTGNLRP
jgi:hypothetical protein